MSSTVPMPRPRRGTWASTPCRPSRGRRSAALCGRWGKGGVTAPLAVLRSEPAGLSCPLPRQRGAWVGVQSMTGRKPAAGPPRARLWQDLGEYDNLILPGDVPALALAAGCNLASKITADDAAAEFSAALSRAISGMISAAFSDTWADVRKWLGDVEASAENLLEQLGFIPAQLIAPEHKRPQELKTTPRPLFPYMAHLAAAFIEEPPDAAKSMILRGYLNLYADDAPHRTVLAALPECLGVLIACAAENRRELTAGKGKPFDRFAETLWIELTEAHIQVFGRKPRLRNDAMRPSLGAVWAQEICKLAASRAKSVAHADALAVSAAFQTRAGMAPESVRTAMGGVGRPTRTRRSK